VHTAPPRHMRAMAAVTRLIFVNIALAPGKNDSDDHQTTTPIARPIRESLDDRAERATLNR